MFLLIFESLGTSELILIGIVALIFLGPRKLPLMARKAGKLIAEFRASAGEFRETWAREVNFEEEAKLLNINNLDSDLVVSEKRGSPANDPVVRQVDPDRFKELQAAASNDARPDKIVEDEPEGAIDRNPNQISGPAENDKANWL